ncbi:MAG: Capsule biosynthesis protein CapA [Parcubacteria bacterium OLB19]|nr:MAG: Capsule biosynthesis protein CapA [Parcubacteria bacterium OLB19]
MPVSLWFVGIISLSSLTLAFLNVDSFSSVKEIKHGEFSAVQQKLDVEKKYKDTIYFVGDVMLARHVEHLLNTYGTNYIFENLEIPNIENSYLVGNFESSIAPKHVKTPNFHFQFSTNPKYINTLSEFGFTHLSLANNHSFDYGREGYLQAISNLEKNKINAFGHPTQLATSSVTFLELEKHKIAIVGIHTLFIEPTDTDLEQVFAWAEDNSDLQVAYMHWGTEYSLKQSDTQREYAKKLVEVGADLIIGHHPHVVQGIERINDNLVFYSLGNFVFDQYFSEEVREGLVLALTEKEGNLAIEFLPISSKNNLAQPNFMTETDSVNFLNLLAKRSDSSLFESINNRKISLEKTLATSTETAIMAE